MPVSPISALAVYATALFEQAPDLTIGGGVAVVAAVLGYAVKYAIDLIRAKSEASTNALRTQSDADMVALRTRADLSEKERVQLFEEARKMREDLRREILDLHEKFNTLQLAHINCRSENMKLIEQIQEFEKTVRSLTERIKELEAEVIRLRSASPA